MHKRNFSASDAVFLLFSIALCAAVVRSSFFYMRSGTTALKATVSAGFVLLGAINMLYALLVRAGKKPFLFSMLSGLFLSLVGDIAIDQDFVIGAAAFALGHIAYFTAYCFLCPLRMRDLLYGAMVFILSALTLYSSLLTFRSGSTQLVCLAYATVISLMVGKSFANGVRIRTVSAALLALGSALFYFSDLMLVLRRFGGIRGADDLCIATYYPAQCLLGFSLFVHVYASKRRLHA